MTMTNAFTRYVSPANGSKTVRASDYETDDVAIRALVEWIGQQPESSGDIYLPGRTDDGSRWTIEETVDVGDPGRRWVRLDGGRLQMELTVERGRGYVEAEENKSDDDPISTIPIDSLFSPIEKVNYKVTNARVKQRTDYDKLTLEVWTDGSVDPEDAVAYAAKILKEQLTIFINFDESIEPPPEEEDEEPEFNEDLLKPIEELELSVRSFNCLQTAGIEYVGDLVQKTDAELLKTKNFGRKSLKEIKDILDEMELELGTGLENWPPSDLQDDDEEDEEE